MFKNASSGAQNILNSDKTKQNSVNNCDLVFEVQTFSAYSSRDPKNLLCHW